MINNKLNILTKSKLYTDFYSEYIRYKGKRIKIIIKYDTCRFISHLYLLTSTGLNEFACSTDFNCNVNVFNCNDNVSIDKKYKLIGKLRDLSRDYIMKLF